MEELLDGWDISETDALLQSIAINEDKKAEAVRAGISHKKAGLQQQYDEAREQYELTQKQLKHAYSEWNQRILEYDTCVQEGKGHMDIMEAVKRTIEDAAEHLEGMKTKAAEASDHFQSMKGDLMSFEQENKPEEVLPGVKIPLKVLADVLFKDIGGNRKKDGRWPMIIDPSKRATMFVRYRDTNYLNACSSKDMSKDIIRKSLLGSLRYGKPMVVDMMDVDMYEAVIDCFDLVQKGLYDDIITGKILKDENYMSLVTKDDGDEYQYSNFQDDKVKEFIFVTITYQRRPTDQLMDKFYCIHVKADTAD